MCHPPRITYIIFSYPFDLPTLLDLNPHPNTGPLTLLVGATTVSDLLTRILAPHTDKLAIFDDLFTRFVLDNPAFREIDRRVQQVDADDVTTALSQAAREVSKAASDPAVQKGLSSVMANVQAAGEKMMRQAATTMAAMSQEEVGGGGGGDSPGPGPGSKKEYKAAAKAAAKLAKKKK